MESQENILGKESKGKYIAEMDLGIIMEALIHDYAVITGAAINSLIVNGKVGEKEIETINGLIDRLIRISILAERVQKHLRDPREGFVKQTERN